MKSKLFYTCLSCIVILAIAIITSFSAVAGEESIAPFAAKNCRWLQITCPNGKIIEICVDEVGDGNSCKDRDCGTVTRNCNNEGGSGA